MPNLFADFIRDNLQSLLFYITHEVILLLKIEVFLEEIGFLSEQKPNPVW